MNHTDIINLLIAHHGYSSYLEIGVQRGINFTEVKAARKVGVDPDPDSKATLHCTSDVFFASNTERFDLVFIDGDHTHEQVYRDITNACKIAHTVVVHDLNPRTEIMQRVPRETKEWTGDGWKAWVAARTWMQYEMFVVDTDYGVGIIDARRVIGSNISCYSTLDYKEFSFYKKEFLNLITVEELCKKYERQPGPKQS